MADSRSTTPHLERYYDRRAAEYEKVYDKPERQHELEWLRTRIPQLLAARTVLEVACGTGYWTQFLARTAYKVHACDINESVLEIAREKDIARGRVDFFKADAVSLEVRVTNWGAQRLYSRFGFRPVGIRKNYYQEIGEDALIMWLDGIRTPEFRARIRRVIGELPEGIRPSAP